MLALPMRRRAPYQGLTARCAATLNLGSRVAANPDTLLAVAEAATSPCADLHAASGQCSCPHMRAAFKLLAVQTTRRRAWAC